MSITAPENWTMVKDRLTRVFLFKSFASAIEFMVEISHYCDRVDHHPEWKNIYNRIWVELTTHDAGGVTAKDVALADHMNDVFKRFAS